MQRTTIVTCFYIFTKCFTFEHSPTMNNIPTTLYQPIIIDGLHREIDLYDLGILRDHENFILVYINVNKIPKVNTIQGLKVHIYLEFKCTSKVS